MLIITPAENVELPTQEELELTDEQLEAVTGAWGGCDEEGRREGRGENEQIDFERSTGILNNVHVLTFGSDNLTDVG